jgi:oligoribonuclease
MLGWIDLEMTGLDPERDLILEIAALVTDDNLVIVAEGPDIVVHQPSAALDAMDPVVVKMHDDSGLRKAVEASTVSLEEAGAAVLAFLRQHLPEPRTVPLCGNSIATDRSFLLRHLPDVDAWFHYRSIDVSTVKELCRRWYPEAYDAAPTKAGHHRALDDIRESVAELRYYRELMFKDPATVALPAREPAPPAAPGPAA